MLIKKGKKIVAVRGFNLPPNDKRIRKWRLEARASQLEPPGDWNIWMILAGRGFGKTRTAAETIRKWVLEDKYRRIALIGNTIHEARHVMVEGESGLLAVTARDGKKYRPKFIPSKHILQWKNGAIATLYGAENYEHLRGPQFDAAWIDEFAKFMYPKETFEQLSFSLRLGEKPRVLLTTTPRPLPFIKDLMNRDDVVTTRGTSLENIENLSPTFLKQLEYLKGTRLEAQEIYAEIVEDSLNTLWSWDDIERCYKNPPHFIDDVVIGVDPALTCCAVSDETGIVVAGKDANGKAYVLDDLSISATPDIWGQRVIDAYHKYRARVVVIEKNAGGDLLENLIKSKDPNVHIKMVYANNSKNKRAEPIVLLYQKKLIFHARQFHKLEMQMATYEHGAKSPDRLDAMVWAMRELFNITVNTDQLPMLWQL